MERQPGLLRRMDDTGIPLLLIRLVLAGAFISMGLSKMLDPVDFLKLVREYHLLPESPPHFLNLTAVALPALEVVCGVALLAGVAVRGAAVTFLGMLVVFTGAVLVRSLAIYGQGDVAYCAIRFDCGCGGGDVFICTKILENAGLILLSLMVVMSRSRRFCLSGLLSRSTQRAAFAS
ncbi:MAG: DoxX family membrane protein [Phycisphaerales bacterium]|nr:MAG: DoxX family membrane protein [Phycisphaerales bacterium]